MKKIIADNDHYFLAVDTEKQRLYISLMGQWSTTEQISGYLEDVKTSIYMFIDQFSCLADFAKLLPFDDQWKFSIHAKALQIMFNSGMKYSAQVMPEDYEASEQLMNIINGQGEKVAAFGDAQLAELYLDSKAMMSY